MISKPSSEYPFPIFISSTDYNLIDLRAELSSFLKGLGYQPVLSSREGFHDHHPDLQPWESCLRVLESCFVVVLIVDGRYGAKLPFDNYKNELGDDDLSPTHAEYRYARHLGKRVIVFVRDEIQTFYQSYREVSKKYKENKNSTKKSKIKWMEGKLRYLLPKHIDFDTLEFFSEIKTESPIPWIRSFKYVTEIKSEIQKKLINQLAETFLLREKHLYTIIDSFSRALNDMDPEGQIKVLSGIGATNEFLVHNRESNKELEKLRGNISELKKERDDEVNKGKRTEQQKKELESKVKKLEEEKRTLENQINHENRSILKDKIYSDGHSGNPVFQKMMLNHSNDGLNNYDCPHLLYRASVDLDFCGKCSNSVEKNALNLCTKCFRSLCSDCWPSGSYSRTFQFYGWVEPYCPDCSSKKAPESIAEHL